MVGGWLGRRRNTNSKKRFNIRFFRLNTLRIATNNFSNLLGRGAFGSVYKGVLPDDGTTVAIKRHDKLYDGFLEMVEFMSHLRHINLIQVLGCCVENGEQLLVCEFADNGNLTGLLHGNKRSALDWETRASICIGIARGLSYLHEDINPRVIHRDIKPSNILLDANFNPKIADFDLYIVDGNLYAEGGKRTVKCGFPDLDDTSTYTTTVKGTMGYLDPNYVLTGQLTEKVDVYSFGLTILEIVTGRRAVDLAPEVADDRMILNWVRRVRREGMVLKIVDPKLTDFPKEDVERFINVALLCTRGNSEERPSMFEVVHMLYGRLKSDREISDIATMAIADQPAQWSTACSFQSVSMSSKTISSSSIGTDCEAEMESREESDERSIVPNCRKNGSRSKGECSSSKKALAPAADTSFASCSKEEEQSSAEDVVRDYFERSMEKIMRFHVAMPRETNRATTRNQTIVMNNKSSQHTFMEAVYPPFLSGEYRRTSRVLYSERVAPL